MRQGSVKKRGGDGSSPRAAEGLGERGDEPSPPLDVRVNPPFRCNFLHEFFERAAGRWPDRVAVEVPPKLGERERMRITYAGLDHQSDVLARRLQPFVTGECVVGILLPRDSAQLYAAQLAVLKAGAAHTCLDPSFPAERVRDILEDAGVVALLTDAAGLERVRNSRLKPERLLDVRRELAAAEAGMQSSASCSSPFRLEKGVRPPWLTPTSLAYIIYTSGTTGRPKGAMIEHRSIANLIAADLDEFHLTPDDRVGQGSSAAYDSSIEETWLAFSSGATLVVMDDETARLGPDLIPFLREERISVFCPPPTLLRATGCDHPEAALPDLKFLYVGGEELPRDVADRWARGRRLVNGYGPTECTVTCLRARIEEDAPVTIGRPVAGLHAWVLNELLEEVAEGEEGELCLGGIGLARGYWKRPELTAEKFMQHPRLGRIYRSGDLVHRRPDGQILYHGRIDSQVKLRGYRVELGEIESRLAECAGVRAAACRVQEDRGNPTLVAFVVPDDASHPPPADALTSALGAVLPAYMVPARYAFLRELPTTVGGKLDRAVLPRVDRAEREACQQIVAPRNGLETKLEAAFRDILQLQQAVSIEEDFFKDLGGDSLSAAQLVTRLRDDAATSWVTVRDIYEARTVAELGKRVPAETIPEGVDETERALAKRGEIRDAVERVPTVMSEEGRPVLATVIQTAWLLTSVVIGSVIAYIVAIHLLPKLTLSVGLAPLVLLAPPALLLGLAIYVPLSLGLAVLVKKILIGRYRPLQAPVWGSFFVRNWMVQQTVKRVPWWLLEGTEFQNAALRVLGARIGKRVHLHRGVNLLHGGWDLLEIGDDVTVSQDAAIRLVEFESGQIIIGPVSLGNGSTLDVHSGVGSNSRVEPDAYLTASSSLPRGGVIPRGERWNGIPARPAGSAPLPPSLPVGEQVLPPHRAGFLLMLARLGLLAVLGLPAELFAIALAAMFGVDGESAVAWLLSPSLDVPVFLACMAAVAVPVPVTLALQALACRAMGRAKEGVISLWSAGYVRLYLKAGLTDSGSRWLYGTLFWPVWLRLAGMKVGGGCEISGLIDTIPEMVEIGAGTFCADGIYLAGPRLHRGTVSIAPVRLGKGIFLGNGAIVAGGQQLPDGVLLGICTVAEGTAIRPGTAWFGHPPFELPRRQVIEFDRRLTHNPSPVRYSLRLFWELLRFALPVIAGLIIPAWFKLLTGAEAVLPWPVFLLVALPLLSLGTMAFSTLVVIVMKWALLGRVRPGTHPLWSSFASRWDFMCVAWNLYAVEAVSALDGTLLLAMLLRAVGARVGRRVVLGPGFAEDVPDPDMLTFEDGATVDCHLQAHTFEDRVLKMDRVTVRRGGSVCRNAVLLYGAEVGAGTRVAPNSVVMKHEHLLPNRDYAGFPIRA